MSKNEVIGGIIVFGDDRPEVVLVRNEPLECSHSHEDAGPNRLVLADLLLWMEKHGSVVWLRWRAESGQWECAWETDDGQRLTAEAPSALRAAQAVVEQVILKGQIVGKVE